VAQSLKHSDNGTLSAAKASLGFFKVSFVGQHFDLTRIWVMCFVNANAQTYTHTSIHRNVMFQVKVRKIGNSSVVSMSSEMLSALDVKDGDTVYVALSDDRGLKISAHDPQVVVALKAAEWVMDENSDLLQAWA
jgi:antitoxin ChpS